jgi:hypothetical protein
MWPISVCLVVLLLAQPASCFFSSTHRMKKGKLATIVVHVEFSWVAAANHRKEKNGLEGQSACRIQSKTVGGPMNGVQDIRLLEGKTEPGLNPFRGKNCTWARSFFQPMAETSKSE